MTIRQTHTYAELELSPAAYDEIAQKLRAAGYDHAFMEDGAIDMHGIGVTKADVQPPIQDAVNWAAERWHAEVANRPLQNVHRRALDGTWRQVIRHFGGDPKALCGPSHDELISP